MKKEVDLVEGKRTRLKLACSNCRKAKKKCGEQRPCGRCVRVGKGDSCCDNDGECSPPSNPASAHTSPRHTSPTHSHSHSHAHLPSLASRTPSPPRLQSDGLKAIAPSGQPFCPAPTSFSSHNSVFSFQQQQPQQQQLQPQQPFFFFNAHQLPQDFLTAPPTMFPPVCGPNLADQQPSSSSSSQCCDALPFFPQQHQNHHSQPHHLQHQHQNSHHESGIPSEVLFFEASCDPVFPDLPHPSSSSLATANTFHSSSSSPSPSPCPSSSPFFSTSCPSRTSHSSSSSSFPNSGFTTPRSSDSEQPLVSAPTTSSSSLSSTEFGAMCDDAPWTTLWASESAPLFADQEHLWAADASTSSFLPPSVAMMQQQSQQPQFFFQQQQQQPQQQHPLPSHFLTAEPLHSGLQASSAFFSHPFLDSIPLFPTSESPIYG